MLTVHLVAKATLDEYALAQRGKADEVVIGNGPARLDAMRQARDAAVLGRSKNVLAVVPQDDRDPTQPALTNEWSYWADEIISVPSLKLVKSR